MKLVNLAAGIQNPIQPFEKANWYQAKVNIIYIPFSMTKISNWYHSDVQFKQYYKTFIVPDKVHIGSIPVRRIQNYITELKKELKSIQVHKTVKNSIHNPVIVDLSPIAYTFWQLVASRGIRYVATDFFNFVHNIYLMLVGAQNLNASETVTILDFTNEYMELEKLLLYLKLSDYQFPTQIADRYVLFHHQNLYLTLTTDSSMEVSRVNYNKLLKIAKTKNESEIKKDLEQENTQEITKTVDNDITEDLIKKTIQSKFNKNINDELEIKSITNLVKSYIKNNPELEVNVGDPGELAEVIKQALQSQLKIKNITSINDLFEKYEKQFIYKKDVNPDLIHNKKTIGINALKATGIKWFTDSERTKIEFDENLDQNIEKLIESLNDPKFGFTVQGISKTIEDDGKSRYYVYKIKIKPEKGRAYDVKLKVPALVHGTYFKIGGNLYAINNQLMQLPIIKKNMNTVQLKTNYSVTDYSIKSFPQTIKTFNDVLNKFLNIMKVNKKLKEADVMDAATETVMRNYGIPVEAIAKINYKKIIIKD